MSAIPRWLIVLIVIALVIFLANLLGIIRIHGSIQGGVGL